MVVHAARHTRGGLRAWSNTLVSSDVVLARVWKLGVCGYPCPPYNCMNLFWACEAGSGFNVCMSMQTFAAVTFVFRGDEWKSLYP